MSPDTQSRRVILSLIILSIVISVVAGAFTDSELKECKKFTRKVLKQILKELGVCNSEWKNKTKSQEEHSKKMGCVVRCILDKEQMLDEHGLVTSETIIRSVGDRAPDKFKKLALRLFHQCDDQLGKTLQPNDELCAGYSKFGNCIQNSIADMCHVDIPF
ncbi:unnamed protein product [Allacma fusca]|uniref:Uncharacterized protein n=1 Tax=Allacma fusca TaxID=39272 RepID=A0A8J2L6C5_9HEXA|nr:unnamed protein product [Allacma fusca]